MKDLTQVVHNSNELRMFNSLVNLLVHDDEMRGVVRRSLDGPTKDPMFFHVYRLALRTLKIQEEAKKAEELKAALLHDLHVLAEKPAEELNFTLISDQPKVVKKNQKN